MIADRADLRARDIPWSVPGPAPGDDAAWADLHIAPTAQRDRTQIILACAHALAATEGVGGRSSSPPRRPRDLPLRGRMAMIWPCPARARCQEIRPPVPTEVTQRHGWANDAGSASRPHPPCRLAAGLWSTRNRSVCTFMHRRLRVNVRFRRCGSARRPSTRTESPHGRVRAIVPCSAAVWLMRCGSVR